MPEDTKTTRSVEYTERIRAAIKEGLANGSHYSSIKAEGKLIIMEFFQNELDQAREWVKFLEILGFHLEARVGQDQPTAKRSLFRRAPETEAAKTLRDLQLELSRAKLALNSLEAEDEMKRRRAERSSLTN